MLSFKFFKIFNFQYDPSRFIESNLMKYKQQQNHIQHHQHVNLQQFPFQLPPNYAPIAAQHATATQTTTASPFAAPAAPAIQTTQQPANNQATQPPQQPQQPQQQQDQGGQSQNSTPPVSNNICNICNKMISKKNMARHKKTKHSDEKKFVCSCSYATNDKGNFNRHKRLNLKNCNTDFETN